MSKKQEPSIGFGARLAKLRKEAGYTQVELAEILGISQRMVAYYENTDDHPLAKYLRHMSAALDVSADEMLGVADAAPASQAPQTKPRRPRKT